MNIHRTLPAAPRPDRSAAATPVFTWPHTVTFGETNVMGNVYFARHFEWQGDCREMFLKTYCPGIVSEFTRDLRLVTLNAHAEFFDELFAFDEIELRMRLGFLQQHRIGLRFDTVKKDGNGWSQAASGAQDVACMRLRGGKLEPAAIPSDLFAALIPFAAHTAPR
ncbi:MAG: acyl-CoA thioesterase [Proteobacteria bacterium]|nr:acyl-CoA thioesterase [Pseudomonadota bacterium]